LKAFQEIKKIAVVGAGTMGLGIAQVAALAGYNVVLNDVNNEILEKGIYRILSNLEKGIVKGKISVAEKNNAIQRIQTESELNNLHADFAIEAVVEKIEAKIKILSTFQKLNPESVLASNTSSIPITLIGNRLIDPGKLVGMHFFNPAHVMKLVEVISGADTEPEVVRITVKVAEKMGKVAVEVKDSPGFIVNRVARHFYLESLKILEDGVSNVKDIDELLEASGFRMGPFRLMDLIGIDTNFSVTKTIFDQFHEVEKFKPNRIQKQMVDAGTLGKKTGHGFYKYN